MGSQRVGHDWATELNWTWKLKTTWMSFNGWMFKQILHLLHGVLVSNKKEWSKNRSNHLDKSQGHLPEWKKVNLPSLYNGCCGCYTNLHSYKMTEQFTGLLPRAVSWSHMKYNHWGNLGKEDTGSLCTRVSTAYTLHLFQNKKIFSCCREGMTDNLG